MKLTATLAAVSLAMAISLAPGAAKALGVIEANVDCAITSLAALIDGVSQRPSVAVVLTIKGTCTEDITIEFNDLTLKGDPVDGGTISGTIFINGAKRVVIDDLTVTGAGSGIVGFDAAAFTVNNSNIIDNAETGIVVVRSSSAVLNNNTIRMLRNSPSCPEIGLMASACPPPAACGAPGRVLIRQPWLSLDQRR